MNNMSRVTIEIAKNVAEKMTSKKQSELNNLRKECSEICRDYIIKGIPKKVMDFFKIKS